jgi:hypothetical protein
VIKGDFAWQSSYFRWMAILVALAHIARNMAHHVLKTTTPLYGIDVLT